MFRDQKWRGRFPAILDQNNAPAPLPSSSNDKRTWNNQVEQKAQNGNPQKRQRRIGNSSSVTPSGQKLFGAFNSAKGCPDERYCPQKALHRCNITSTDGRVCFATTMEHINIVHGKPASTLLWIGRGQKTFSRTTLWLRKLDYSSIAPNILRGLGEVICCKSLGARDSMDWLLSSTCGLASVVLCSSSSAFETG